MNQTLLLFEQATLDAEQAAKEAAANAKVDAKRKEEPGILSRRLPPVLPSGFNLQESAKCRLQF
jgi:hypothetical protein